MSTGLTSQKIFGLEFYMHICDAYGSNLTYACVPHKSNHLPTTPTSTSHERHAELQVDIYNEIDGLVS